MFAPSHVRNVPCSHRPMFASLPTPQLKLLLKECAQYKRELARSTGGRATQVGLELTGCVCPLKLIEPEYRAKSLLKDPVTGTVPTALGGGVSGTGAIVRTAGP